MGGWTGGRVGGGVDGGGLESQDSSGEARGQGNLTHHLSP